MKTMIIAAAISATLAAPAPIAANHAADVPNVSGIYAKSAVVIALDADQDIVTVADSCGMTWSFSECEDYELFDIVNMVMWDNGTTDAVLDDVILCTRYSGFVSADFQ